MIGRVAFALILGGVVAHEATAQVPGTTTTPAENPAPPATAIVTGPTAPPSTTPQPAPAQTQPRTAAPADIPPPLPTPAALPDRPANQPQGPGQAPAQNQAARAPRAVNDRDPQVVRGRFANPGGVGRYQEYYTPNTPMHGYPGQPIRPSGFGQGGGLTRQDQIEAFRVGQYRTQNIQNNINAYGRPLGFGFGIGLGYGRGLGGYR